MSRTLAILNQINRTASGNILSKNELELLRASAGGNRTICLELKPQGERAPVWSNLWIGRDLTARSTGPASNHEAIT